MYITDFVLLLLLYLYISFLINVKFKLYNDFFIKISRKMFFLLLIIKKNFIHKLKKIK